MKKHNLKQLNSAIKKLNEADALIMSAYCDLHGLDDLHIKISIVLDPFEKVIQSKKLIQEFIKKHNL